MGEKKKERKKNQSDQFRDRQTIGKTISAPTVSRHHMNIVILQQQRLQEGSNAETLSSLDPAVNAGI
jgi:hypothetical protein